MNNLYNMVIQATVYGSIVGIIIYILKSTVLRRLPARWQYLLWSVMIIKLIFPKGPESSISLFNNIKVDVDASRTELIGIAKNAVTVDIPSENTYNILPFIWFIGFLAVLLWIIISFIMLNFKIRAICSASKDTLEILEQCKRLTGVKRKISAVVQNHIHSPALCGILFPKILITKEFEKSDISNIEYTFIHELSHYKRGDIFVNYLLLLLRCVHWFNPVVWFLFSRIRRDAELATDERTMLCINPSECRSYGMTLIDNISVHSGKSPMLLGIAHNKQDIKKRIKAIAIFKKPRFIQHILGALTIVLTASVCLTSAAIAKPVSDIIYESIPKVTVAENTAQDIKPVVENTAVTEESIPKEEQVIAEDSTEQITNEGTDTDIDIDIDTLINGMNLNIHSGEGTVDMKSHAGLIYFNSDSEERNHFILKPNEDGTINILAEAQGCYDYMIPVDISNVKTPGYGWGYVIYPQLGTPFYIYGLDPNEEYIVFIDTYCPGHYGITGRILIY